MANRDFACRGTGPAGNAGQGDGRAVRIAERAERLRERFGDVMAPGDLAAVLRYPSEESVVKAHARGVLPVPLAKFPRRRGWFVTVEVVAECLDELEDSLRGRQK